MTVDTSNKNEGEEKYESIDETISKKVSIRKLFESRQRITITRHRISHFPSDSIKFKEDQFLASIKVQQS